MRQAGAGGPLGSGASLPGGGLAALATLAVLVLVAAAAAQAGVAHGRIVMLLLIAPLAEEALFRAGLHETLLRRALPRWVANGVTALVFAGAHTALRGDIAAFVLVVPALLIGAIYEDTRRVRDCVLAHAAMNALWLVAGLAGLAHTFAP